MKPSRMFFLPLRVLAVLALPLSAQQAPLDLAAEMDDILSTDQIGAASKHVQDVASAPADVVVLRASELKALGYRTLGDALGGVLGFRTNEDHAFQGLASAGVYALGDQNTRILVLLDGHALNSPAEVGSSKVGEDFGLPLELVDHIEVVRGPASSLYGNNAFQALVNVVSLSAAGAGQKPFQAALTAGTGGLSELWAQQTLTFGGVTSSLMLSGYQRTGTTQYLPQQPNGLGPDADREERQSAYLYVKGGQWSFSGALLSRTQRLASAPFGSVPVEAGNFYRNRRMSAELKWEPVTRNVRWMLRLFGDKNEFDDGFVADNGNGPETSFDFDPDRSLGAELQGRAALGEHLTLTFGTEQQFHRFNGLFSAPGAEIRTEVAYNVGNTYLEANWQPSASWNAVAGLQRADWRPTEIRNVNNGVVQEQDKVNTSRLTPRLSVIWKPLPADVVKFIYGQGFRFPTIFEAYFTDGSSLAAGASQSANPAIKPEVLTSAQVSWSRKWSARLSTHGALIFYRGEHTILPGTDSAGLAQFQNSPEPIRGRAVETELAWHQGGTEVSAGAGWYDWTSQGATLSNSSRWLGVFKAIQRSGDWSLAGEARYVGGRQTFDPATGLTTVPANWTLRTSLRREWGWGWAQGTVEDLTNSRRRDLVGAEYAPITWMEGDGRALRATLGVKF